MPRSKWKLPHVDPEILEVIGQYHRSIDEIHAKDPDNLLIQDKKKLRPIKVFTNARNCTITTSFCGLSFQVHNGNRYQSIKITPDHVGKKLGEFSHTRKILKHKEVKKKTIGTKTK